MDTVQSYILVFLLLLVSMITREFYWILLENHEPARINTRTYRVGPSIGIKPIQCRYNTNAELVRAYDI